MLTLTSCGQTTHGTATAPAADAGSPGSGNAAAGHTCATVDVPLLEVETHSDSEPRIRIPQPPGWERFSQMDSEIIRAAIVNKSLTADGFAPNAVLALDAIPQEIAPQEAFDMGRKSLENLAGGTDMKVTDDTLCGWPAETVHYTLSVPPSAGPHPAVVRSVVATAGDHTFIASLTIQSTRPDDPTYQRDSEMILDGLQVLPPANGGHG